jgi:hypothetical protein
MIKASTEHIYESRVYAECNKALEKAGQRVRALEVVVGKNRSTTITLVQLLTKYVKVLVDRVLTAGMNAAGVSGFDIWRRSKTIMFHLAPIPLDWATANGKPAEWAPEDWNREAFAALGEELVASNPGLELDCPVWMASSLRHWPRREL